MKSSSLLRHLLLAASITVAALAHAATPDELIKPIQERWAQIKYQSPEK